MNGFGTDTGELRDGARVLTNLSNELGDHSATRWFMAPEEVGHHGLAAELEAFQTHLTNAIVVFRRDVEEASDRLRATADDYEDLDNRSYGEDR